MSIYGEHRERLEAFSQRLMKLIEDYREEKKKETGMDPVEHCLCRIKSDESMREKCRRKGYIEDHHSALERIHDAVGIRVVCPFISDVYAIRDHLLSTEGIISRDEKDYIRHAKPNGYRSLHLILYCEDNSLGLEGYYAEVQLRTISMDTWAALEHHLKYKKDVQGNTELIVKELKRCADELASTDVSMQTIRDMILGESLS
ncbi:MAG: GTP pyrophosphokinase family protein [Lachnospiraceae bacterium]|nr:GTP pyrophosphokinase family protein [Lachnospiraceae bacterium]